MEHALGRLVPGGLGPAHTLLLAQRRVHRTRQTGDAGMVPPGLLLLFELEGLASG